MLLFLIALLPALVRLSLRHSAFFELEQNILTAGGRVTDRAAVVALLKDGQKGQLVDKVCPPVQSLDPLQGLNLLSVCLSVRPAYWPFWRPPRTAARRQSARNSTAPSRRDALP